MLAFSAGRLASTEWMHPDLVSAHRHFQTRAALARPALESIVDADVWVAIKSSGLYVSDVVDLITGHKEPGSVTGSLTRQSVARRLSRLIRKPHKESTT